LREENARKSDIIFFKYPLSSLLVLPLRRKENKKKER